MPDSTLLQKPHSPVILVDTANLSRDEWLAYRRHGIGGSDVAAVLGISPFRTARDIYYDKLNIASAEDNESNWVALEMGHLLEDLVARIFQQKTEVHHAIKVLLLLQLKSARFNSYNIIELLIGLC